MRKWNLVSISDLKSLNFNAMKVEINFTVIKMMSNLIFEINKAKLNHKAASVINWILQVENIER